MSAAVAPKCSCLRGDVALCLPAAGPVALARGFSPRSLREYCAVRTVEFGATPGAGESNQNLPVIASVPAIRRAQERGVPEGVVFSRAVTSDVHCSGTAFSQSGCADLLDDGSSRVFHRPSELTAQPASAWDRLLDVCFFHALVARQALPLHGATFRFDSRVVVIAAPSWSGKSTLCAAALAAGAEVLSDDAIVTAHINGTMAVLPLRRFLAFRGLSANILRGRWRRLLREAQGEDGRLWVLQGHEACRSTSFPLQREALLWIPSIDRRRRTSVAKRVSGAVATAAVLRAVSSFYPVAAASVFHYSTLQLAAGLVSLMPAFSVQLGSDLQESPERTVLGLLAAM